MTYAVAAVLDAALVLVFAAVGRRSHAEGVTLVGILETAWPFLAGVALGWLLGLLVGRSAPAGLGFGAVVVVCAVVVGMLLRVLVTGAGTAASFVVVATGVLAAFLVGWRLLATWLG